MNQKVRNPLQNHSPGSKRYADRTCRSRPGPLVVAWIGALLALAWGTTSARAATASWNIGSGAWNHAANWNTSIVPGAGLVADVVNFGSAASTTGTVTLDDGAGHAFNPLLSSLVINPVGGSNAGFTINAGAGGHLTMAANATITWSTGPGTGQTNAINAGMVLQGSLAVSVLANAGAALTIGGVISDGGQGFGVAVSGPGKLTLTGANTYTGTTTVSSGTLNLNVATGNALSGNLLVNGGSVVLQQNNQIADGKTVTVSSGSLNIGVNSDTVAGVQITGGSVTGTTGVLTSTSAYDLQAGTVSARLGGAVGLNKTTVGAATLSASNTYTGITTVSAGTLTLSAPLGNAVAGTVVVNGGSLVLGLDNQIADGKTLSVSSGSFGIGTHSETVAGVQLTGGSITGSTGVLASNAAFDMQSGTVGAVLGGSVGLNKTTSGTVTLTGANTYSGTTTVAAGTLNLNTTGANAVAGNVLVSGGTLVLQQNSQIPAGKTITVSSGTLSMGAHTQTVAGLQMTGGNLTATTGVLTSTTPFDLRAGSVGGILGGAVGLNKTTSGTVTLTGANTYTGTTTVSGGTLNLNRTGGTAIVGDVLVNGGTLVLQQSNQIAASKTLTVSSGTLSMGVNSQTVAGVQLSGGTISGTTGTLISTSDHDLQSGTVNANLGGSVGANKTTAGTVTLFGSNSYTGTTTASAGTLNLNSLNGNAIPGDLVVNGGTVVILRSNQIPVAKTIAVAGGLLSFGTISSTVAGVQLTGGTLNGTTGVLTSTTTFDLQNGTVGAQLGGSVGVDKTSAGSVTFTGLNSYTGVTSVMAGTLTLNTTSGNAVIGNVLVNGGTLAFLQSNQIRSSQTLVVSSGALELGSASQTLAGVQLTGGNLNGTGRLTSTTDFDLQGGVVNLVLAGNVATAVTKGTTTLNNQNTYIGTTTVSANGGLNLGSAPGPALAGALTVNGTGTATLLLDNQFAITSAVKVLGGTLDMGAHSSTVASVQLTGGGHILGSGTLTSRSSFDLQSGTVNAVLGGTVGLNVSGGTVNLGGANTYAGVTTILSGTLNLQGSTAGSSTMVVDTAGTLAGMGTVNGNALLTGNGVINMASAGTIGGTLNVTGGHWNGLGTVVGAATSSSGTFTLGSNAVLTVQAGLNVTGGSFAGSGTVAGNVTLSGTGGIAFDPSGTVTGTLTVLAGTFNGTGNVNALMLGSGASFSLGSGAMLTLSSGQFSTAGGFTSINGGALVAPGGFKINALGTLHLESNLSSPAGLIKTGAGTLQIGGTVVLGGTTEIRAGTLTLDGTLTTTLLELSPGTTFNGSGVLQGSFSNLGGTFNPGHSPGTLQVTGDFSQNAASTLVLEVLNSSVHDRIIASGTVHLAGTLAVRDWGGHHFAYGDMVPDFVQAANIVGGFTQVTMPASNLRGRVVNNGTSLTLVAAPASYTLLAQNSNQLHVAQALDRLIGRDTGDVGVVTLALDVLRASRYAAAFNAISPAYYSVLPRIGIEESTAQNGMLQQRFAEIRAAGHATISGQPSQASPPAASTTSSSKGPAPGLSPADFASDDAFWRPWMQLSGQFAQMDTLQSLANNHFDVAGALVGMDRRLGNESAIGASVGYGYTHVGFSAGDSTTIDTGRLTLYGEAGLGDGYFIDASAGGGYANYDTKRPIVFGSIDRLARGQTDGTEVNAAAHFGKDFRLGSWTMTPQMGFQYTRIHVNDFAESGAGALKLAVNDYSAQSLRGTMGAQVAYRAQLSDKVTLTPYLCAGWQHEFDATGEEVHAVLLAAGGTPFSYNGGSPSKDRMQAGAGLVLSMGPDLDFTLGYQAEFGSGDYQSHLIMLKVSYRF